MLNTEQPPLDAAARDELARKAEEVIELRLLYKGAPNNGFSQFDVRAALDHAEEALDAAGSPDVILALLASVRGAEADTARIDWLEREANLEPLLLHDGRGDTRGHRGLGLRPGRLRRDLREAIDAARAHPPTKETDNGESR